MTFKQNAKKEQGYLFLTLTVFSLLFVQSFHLFNIPQILVLGMACIIPFFLRPQEIAAYIICYSMLGTYIQVAYVCLACIISIFIKTKMKLKPIHFIIPAIFLINELIRIIIYPNDEIFEMIRYLVVLFLLVYIFSLDLDQNNRRKVIDACIFSTALVVIMILIETLALCNWNIQPLLNGSLRLGYSEQLDGELLFSSDPNELGQCCSLAISLCLMFIFSEGLKLKYLIPMAVCLLGGSLTVSKTFLLSVAIIFVLFLFGTGAKNNAVKSFLKKCGFLILAALLVFLVLKVNPSYIENLQSRVDSSDITTGRVNNALMYVKALSDNAPGMIFGLGMQNVGAKIGFTGSPHAAIVEMLVCWGIIGTIIISAALMYVTYRNTRNKNICFLNFIPILVFSFVVQTTQLFRLRDHVLSLIVVVVTCGLELGKGE